MHPDALSYVAWARAQLPEQPRSVVEFGSYDVNGSARTLFPEASWHGIDVRPGPRVDQVADVRTYDGEEQFDLVVSTEMLEHCSAPWQAIDAAYKALVPNGHFIATMAAPERAPHDGNGDVWTVECGEHYAGISAAELAEWLDMHSFIVLHIKHDPLAGDIRCLARKGI